MLCLYVLLCLDCRSWQVSYITFKVLRIHYTGAGLQHPTGLEPTRHVHYIVIDKQDNTRYMHGSLPSAHTPTDFM